MVTLFSLHKIPGDGVCMCYWSKAITWLDILLNRWHHKQCLCFPRLKWTKNLVGPGVGGSPTLGARTIHVYTVADLRGRQGHAPPPPGPKFFHFHAVFGQKNRFAHSLWELAPPGENPGSATDIVSTLVCHFLKFQLQILIQFCPFYSFFLCQISSWNVTWVRLSGVFKTWPIMRKHTNMCQSWTNMETGHKSPYLFNALWHSY